jgi:hypothetical protein
LPGSRHSAAGTDLNAVLNFAIWRNNFSVSRKPIPTIGQVQHHRSPSCIGILALDRVENRFVLQTRQMPQL